jgi:hypothetical protein
MKDGRFKQGEATKHGLIINKFGLEVERHCNSLSLSNNKTTHGNSTERVGYNQAKTQKNLGFSNH